MDTYKGNGLRKGERQKRMQKMQSNLQVMELSRIASNNQSIKIKPDQGNQLKQLLKDHKSRRTSYVSRDRDQQYFSKRSWVNRWGYIMSVWKWTTVGLVRLRPKECIIFHLYSN